MKVIKFTINDDYYEELKNICTQQEITIKRMINILLSKDNQYTDIEEYFPDDANHNTKRVTLKVNEELYKGVMKNCGKYDLKVTRYVPYLIYRFLLEDKETN